MRPLTVCAVLLALAGPFDAWAAGPPMAVVASTAPGLNPGDLVEEGQEIAVPSGATVQLFTVTGREINVSGPFSGVPGGDGVPPPEDKLQVLAVALFGRTDIDVADEPSAGVLGNFSQGSLLTTSSKTWCLAGDVETVLVREGTGGGGEAKLVSVADGQSAPLVWNDSAKSADWPSALPPKDGGRYVVQVDGKQQSAFTVRLMAEAANGAGRLAQMAAAGCEEQVEAAIASLKGTAGATSD